MARYKHASKSYSLKKENSWLKYLVAFLLLLNVGQVVYTFVQAPNQSQISKYEKIIHKKYSKIHDLESEIKFNKSQYKKLGLESQYGYGE
ncbi:hypothetical protein CBF68_10215 [Lactobacillus taiwanensis]|uniref:hypothetical protein n=1 Tax=Lactobacillus taiwanensis TaxID=508451 RepID=UPI000B983A2A|nr:hypothetical protein [Lactobacillus taiwanensis]OYS00528.1 hypothetical protein CBF68_10215 [Lactobacillus taiwanensis]